MKLALYKDIFSKFCLATGSVYVEPDITHTVKTGVRNHISELGINFQLEISF